MGDVPQQSQLFHVAQAFLSCFSCHLPDLFQTDALVSSDVPYRSLLDTEIIKAVLSKKLETLYSAKAQFLIVSKEIDCTLNLYSRYSKKTRRCQINLFSVLPSVISIPAYL